MQYYLFLYQRTAPDVTCLAGIGAHSPQPSSLCVLGKALLPSLNLVGGYRRHSPRSLISLNPIFQYLHLEHLLSFIVKSPFEYLLQYNNHYRLIYEFCIKSKLHYHIVYSITSTPKLDILE